MASNPKWIIERDQSFWLKEDEGEHLKLEYKLKNIIFSEKSPYQLVQVLESEVFGRMLVLDGAIQTTALDGHIYNEMITHVPLNLHPQAKRVLIIGGGDCGAAREITKYQSVEQVDMVEIDELVVKVSKKYLPEVSGNLSDERVNFIFADGIEFVKNKSNEYDLIIIDSSDPVGPAVELFSYEFYQKVKNALKEDGMMVCQSQSPLFHQSVFKQTAKHIKDLFLDSKTYIATVPTYPGGFWSFTIGSKKTPIRPQGLTRESVSTRYFNEEIFKACFGLPQFIQDLLAE